MAGKLPGRALDPTTTITINNISFGDNVAVNSSVIVLGNSTVNTVVNSTAVVTPSVNVGSNVFVNTSTIHLGNSTVNTIIHTTGFTGNGAGLHSVNAAALEGNTVANILISANTAANTLAAAAFSNAAARADSAYSNAASYADTKAGQAFTNAVSYAASNTYVNNTFLPLAGGTLTGNITVNATANIVANLSANNVTFRGDVQIDGNLVVSGTSVTLNAASLAVEDNMIYLNNGSQVTHPDLGFAGNYNDGTYKHAGFFRDATDGVWKVFDGYTPEPDASAYIDTSNASFRIADFTANVVTAASINVVSGALTTIAAGNTTITGFANVIGVSNTDGLRVVRNAGVTSQYIELNTNASAAYVTFNSSASNPKDVYYDIPPANNTSDIFHMFRVSALDKLKVNTSVVTVNAEISTGNTTITGFINVSTNTSTFGTAAYVVANGNVGIGTSTPTSKLHVSGGLITQNFWSDASGLCYWGSYPTAYGVLTWDTGYGRIYAQSSGKLYLGGVGTGITVAANDNVGIGMSSPIFPLQVKTNSGTPPQALQLNTTDWTTTIGSAFQFGFGAATGNTYSEIRALSGGYNAWNNLVLQSGGGNVGIGTTTPLSILNLNAATPDLIINGTGTSNYGVKIRYNGSNNHGLHLTYTPNDATAYIENTYQVNAGTVYGDIYFRQNVAGTMTTRMTIKADGGNVGIGTTAPYSSLHAVGAITLGSGSNARPALKPTNFGYSSAYRALLLGSAATDYTTGNTGAVTLALNYDPSINADGSFTGDGREIIFRRGARFVTPNSGDTSFNVRNLVLYDGRVGIGTDTPSDSLHVAGNMRVEGVGNYMYFDTTGGDKQAWIRTINDYVLSLFNNRGTRSEIRIGNELIQLFTGNDTERIRIDSAGRFMLNTTTANTTANTIMTVKSFTSNTSAFMLEVRDSNDVLRSAITDRGAQNWYIMAGDGQEKGSIRYSTPGGFVGILYFDSSGLSRSDFRHVANGGFTWHAHALGTVPPELMRLDNTGNLTIVGTLTESSSITLKENLDPIQDALGAITSLTGYVYDRKDGTAKRRAGLIAEEVETILPNVVKKDNDGNPTGIQYTNLIAYLVECIKELKAEIDLLKGR